MIFDSCVSSKLPALLGINNMSKSEESCNMVLLYTCIIQVFLLFSLPLLIWGEQINNFITFVKLEFIAGLLYYTAFSSTRCANDNNKLGIVCISTGLHNLYTMQIVEIK